MYTCVFTLYLHEYVVNPMQCIYGCIYMFEWMFMKSLIFVCLKLHIIYLYLVICCHAEMLDIKKLFFYCLQCFLKFWKQFIVGFYGTTGLNCQQIVYSTGT